MKIYSDEIETDSFLSGKSRLYCGSTNVQWIRFFPQTNELLVCFHEGGGNVQDPYLYHSSIGEAQAFKRSISKGKFFRSNIYGRPFRRVASNYNP